MIGVTAGVLGLVDRIRAAGLAADVDPDQLDLSPVAVWVVPQTLSEFTLGGGATLTVHCFIVCGNLDTEQVLTLLDDALTGLLPLLPGVDVVDVITITLPQTSAQLPAFRVTADIDL